MHTHKYAGTRTATSCSCPWLAAQYVESGFGLYSNLIPTFCGTVDFRILKSNNLFTDLIFSVKFTQIRNRSFYAKEPIYYCKFFCHTSILLQVFWTHFVLGSQVISTVQCLGTIWCKFSVKYILSWLCFLVKPNFPKKPSFEITSSY